MEITSTKNKVSQGSSFIDETFDARLTGGYHLSLQVGQDGFAFAVFDIKRNKYIVLKTFSFQSCPDFYAACENTGRIIAKEDILSKSYKSISAALIDPRSTLVPVGLYKDDHRNQILSFNHEMEDETIGTDDLKTPEAKNIYAIPSCFTEVLKKIPGKVEILHYSTPLIESILMHYKNLPGKKIVVHVQPTRFEVSVIEGKKLIFYNSFAYQTAEDFIYYLLFACEQLKLNPETLELILIGEIERNSTIYSLLYKYIRNIRFGSRTENFEYSYKLSEVPKHFYYNLFSQYLCV